MSNILMLDDLIARLQAVREQQGNIQVVKHDCEWGLEREINLEVKKVFAENDHLVAYDQEMIDERRQTASEVISEEDIRKGYDEIVQMMADSGYPEERSFEEYLAEYKKIGPSAQKTVDAYDAAPYMLVI